MRQIVHQPNMELTKRYYSISEVAEMFEMNISKLRLGRTVPFIKT
ncbi:hypothetical protein ACFFJX_03840 [Pseudarcicella hirudinis]